MTQTNTTLQSSKQHLANKDYDGIAMESVGESTSNDFFQLSSNKLEFINRLHEAMDFYQLFDVFIEELKVIVPCNSVEYKDESTHTSLVNGVVAKYHCSYVIKYDGQSLGDLRITRDSEFVEYELENIEILLSGLTLPLRNIRRYQQALKYVQRDELTGLRNCNYYYDVIDLEIERAHRYKKSFSLLMFDLDDFENINNKYGSSTGDATLIEVGRRIEQQARSSDIVYRSDGDKFLVFLPNTAKDEALEAAERIKEYVMAITFSHEDNDIPFTLSAGVVTVTNGDNACKLFNRVDKALYHAKILGKDRVYAELSSENITEGFA